MLHTGIQWDQLSTPWNAKTPIVIARKFRMIGWFKIKEALKLELALPVYRKLFRSLEDFLI